MHPKFLPLLCCPDTGESFTLEALVTLENGMVYAGHLRTESGRSYPIVRGVPRFVERQDYSASFGWEWARWPRVQFESENVGRPMAGHTTRMWDRITGMGASLTDDDVRGRTIVDFGCGPGRFLDVVRRKGGIAVGIDLSDAVDAARTNFAHDPDVLVLQADLLRPPLREGAFDGGFSIGVLHHTPDPQQGVSALARIVRPGGWVACCVYPKGDFYDYPSVRRLRTLHRKLSGTFEYLPALLYACFAAHVLAPSFRFLKNLGLRRAVDYVERNWLVSLWLKDPQWRVLDTFDAITPSHATTHTEEEVTEWLTTAGCESVKRTAWCPTSAVSLKGPIQLIDVLPLPPREGRGEGVWEAGAANDAQSTFQRPLALTLSRGERGQEDKLAA
jgi:SAM-dependent methyltransferase